MKHEGDFDLAAGRRTMLVQHVPDRDESGVRGIFSLLTDVTELEGADRTRRER